MGELAEVFKVGEGKDWGEGRFVFGVLGDILTMNYCPKRRDFE